MAKRILPWFGGSAAVWSTCLVFYQIALLAGYLYARLLSRWLKPVQQALVHGLLLLASLSLLPVGPAKRWKPAAVDHPAWQILWMLTASIALPFVVISATSPLLQHWLARGGHESPYRLFALSNFASLAALLAYPTLIEPNLDITSQSHWWSAAYLVFAGCCLAVTIQSRKAGVEIKKSAAPVALRLKVFWFALAACGSMLLLSVTNQITQNVAAVPLLWVLPLAVYLLSFILGFGSERFYQRSLWLRLLAFALGMLAYAVYNIDTVEAIQVSLTIFLAGLFVCCMFCQGELHRLRPATENLTTYYLVIAAGGASGAIFIGLIAPAIFAGIYELPLTLFITAALALSLTWESGGWASRLLWAGVAACMALVFVMNIQAYHENSLTLRRSFYGSLRVVQSPHAGPDQTRTLFHGTIQHGAEFLWPQRRHSPTTYYGPDSGVGIVLRECVASPKRVGVVGLGTGTIAAYGVKGDTFRFYEINHQVIEIAQSLFFYLRETPAQVETVEGDGRLSLEHDSSPPFDVLAVDAFSGDAIPVHLLTREAVALYLHHLTPNGVLAFHVSNNYLELAPVVQQLVAEVGFTAVEMRSHADTENLVLPAEWVLATRNPAVLDNPAVHLHSQPIESRTGLRPWTDSFNDLLEILKWPTITK